MKITKSKPKSLRLSKALFVRIPDEDRSYVLKIRPDKERPGNVILRVASVKHTMRPADVVLGVWLGVLVGIALHFVVP